MSEHELDATVHPARCLCRGAQFAGSKTSVLAQYAVHLNDVIAAVEKQRDMLAQAMWDVRESFGFDTDGDDTYHPTSLVGWPGVGATFRRDMAEIREEWEQEK